MKDIISIYDLSKEEIDELIDAAEDIRKHPVRYSEACRGRTLATLFFEPSTRTRLSFEAAMYGLGGNCLGFSEGKTSSVAKGESLADTARTVSIYSDIIVMRHFCEGAPCAAGLAATVPVINAGDGGHYHPTQTLADLCTIRHELGRLDHVVIGVCGDLKYGRTVHSLIKAMARYEGTRFVLISPPSLTLPEYIKDSAVREDISFIHTSSLETYMSELDILYMTRIQKERFNSDERAVTYQNYILTPEKLIDAKGEMCVLHPLPRVDEISVKLDSDPRAKYFTQAENGKFIRMALILKLLSAKAPKAALQCQTTAGEKCSNPKCISVAECTLSHLIYRGFDSLERCYYCDSLI